MKRFVQMLVLNTIVMLMFTSTLLAQAVYYVQSAKAKVLIGASFKSASLGEVPKGFKFVSTGREGSWVKVKFDKRDGYVSSLVLSMHPPFEKAGIIKAEDTEIRQGVRRRASSYTSAAAARGLAQDDRRRLSKEEKVNYEALDKMESFTVSADEISRFMEGGKL
jgi:hypothetical protein